MARVMKAVAAKRRGSDVLVVKVGLLNVARGHRALPRGGPHRGAKHPCRAQAERDWRRDV